MHPDDSPIFLQLAAQIADDIVTGAYPEESAIPSATEYALFHTMNPATVSKGVNVLVEQGVLYKKRGIGMFVAAGARELLLTRRRAELYPNYIEPLMHEAAVLGIAPAELARMIHDQLTLQEDNS
ncbi:MAG: GntR family transcriptional regulator [Microbacteriaceae bacterium]